MRNILLIGLTLLWVACTTGEEETVQQPRTGTLNLTSSVNRFEVADGSAVTRANIAGDAFTVGERIKLKVICPFSDHEQLVESTWGNTFDAFWLLKWSGSGWTPITSSDKVDLDADYSYSNASSIFGRYEAQQTPYVYTASTWSENVLFIANGTLYSQYSYIFHADQSKEAHYTASDLLWAQTYMQTGSYDVHLAFDHVMACLKIDISALGLTGTPVVTLEGMPDIDQCEVVVGDYYAAQSKFNSGYGYKQKCSCTKENNGKVLGVAVINESAKVAQVAALDGSEVKNEGVYTAHRDGGYYYLIVPPCTLATNAKIWIREGETRYSYTLERKTFEQGKLYPIKINLPEPTPEP